MGRTIGPGERIGHCVHSCATFRIRHGRRRGRPVGVAEAERWTVSRPGLAPPVPGQE